MENSQAADFEALRHLIESNPHELLSRASEILDRGCDIETKNSLLLYKAMALIIIRDYAQASNLAEQLMDIAVEKKDNRLLTKVYIVMSKCNPEVHTWKKHYLELAYDTAKLTHDKDLIGESLNNLASFHSSEKLYKKAFKYHKAAIDLVMQGGSYYLKEMVLVNAARSYFTTEQYAKAIDHLIQALEQTKQTGDPDSMIMIMSNLGILYQTIHHYPEAKTYFLQALKIAEDNEFINRKIDILCNLGAHLLDRGEHRESEGYLMQCLQVCTEINMSDPDIYYQIYSNLAGIYRSTGDYYKCQQNIELSIEYAEALKNDAYLIASKLNMADLMLSTGKTAEAEKSCKDIISYSLKHKLYEAHISAQELLASIYDRQGVPAKSIAVYKDIMKSYQSYISEVHSSQIEEYRKKIEELHNSQNLAKEQSGSKNSQAIRQKQVFVGNSQFAMRVMEQVRLAASHPNTSILITGESGTGKEIVANLIHRQSTRSSYPLIAINTAAIASTLVESELFGYKKGAFTGAYKDTQGIFSIAQHGTVFLDEISEMPFDLQVKLLRALETRKITPVGGNKELAFDCRIISSTNRDLQAMVDKNTFRLDLLHRLNTFIINIPPLRERKEDIPLLINHYSSLFANEMKVPRPSIRGSFYIELTRYSFPGNVRELINLIERLMMMYPGKEWGHEQLESLNIHATVPNKPIPSLRVKSQLEERQEILEALQIAGGKQKNAAKLLGISESTLTRRIVKYNLESYTLRGK